MRGVEITQWSVSVSLQENNAKIFTDEDGILTIQVFKPSKSAQEILGMIRNREPEPSTHDQAAPQTNYDSFREFLKNS